MQSPDNRPPTLKLLLAFGAIYIVWGSTYLAIRYAVDGIPPLLMMGMRHVAAGGMMLAWLRGRGVKPEPRLWKYALLTGAILFLGGHGLLAWAEQRVDSGLASLLIATEPLLMVVLAGLAGQEKHASARTVVGLLLGMAGIALLFGVSGGQESRWGTAAVLVSATLWSVGAIYARGIKHESSAAMFAAMQMLAGGVLLLTVGAAAGERLALGHISLRAWAALAYLTVFGSIVAFSAYVWLMQVTTAARVSMHCYVNPVVAVFLGWLLAGEAVTGRMLMGAAVVLVGVLLVNTSRREPGPALRTLVEAEEPWLPGD
jgi:drug/metabolite transporter (DMT)-like permease